MRKKLFSLILLFGFIGFLFILFIQFSSTFKDSKVAANAFSNPNKDSFPLLDSLLKQIANTTVTASSAAQNNTDYCLRIPIVMYHHVQPIEIAKELGHDQLTVDSYYFEQQMAYLTNEKYHSISSDELVEALLQHKKLPERSVMITLDDGYDDMYAYAFPILQKYRVIGNFMIPTGLMGTKGYLSWDELRSMLKSPYVKIYNHTWSHAHLASASQENIKLELSRSQSQFMSNLEITPNIISYPYGAFTDEVKAILKEYGFTAGISTIGGIEQCKSQIMELRRIRAGNNPLPPLEY